MVTPVRPLDVTRIRELLGHLSLEYSMHPDGCCLVAFGPRGDRRTELVVRLDADETVFSMTAWLETSYPRSVEQALLEIANAWHGRRCWPRAFVSGEGVGTGEREQVTVYVDHHLFLDSGAHDELLTSAFLVFVAAADDLLCHLETAVEAVLDVRGFPL